MDFERDVGAYEVINEDREPNVSASSDATSVRTDLEMETHLRALLAAAKEREEMN